MKYLASLDSSKGPPGEAFTYDAAHGALVMASLDEVEKLVRGGSVRVQRKEVDSTHGPHSVGSREGFDRTCSLSTLFFYSRIMIRF